MPRFILLISALVLAGTAAAQGLPAPLPDGVEIVRFSDGSLAAGWSEGEQCVSGGICAEAIFNDASSETAIFDGIASPGFIETDNGLELIRDTRAEDDLMMLEEMDDLSDIE